MKQVAKPVGVLIVAMLLFVLMPVDQVLATEVAPETKSETLEGTQIVGSEPGPLGDGSEEPPSDDDSAGGGSDPAEGGAEAHSDEEDAEAGALFPAESSDSPDEPERAFSEVLEAPIPFTGLGFTGTSSEPPTMNWRALREDGTWTDWEPVPILDAFDGPDTDSPEGANARAQDGWVSDAIWVGAATHLQLFIENGDFDEIDVTVIDTAGLSESLLERVQRTFRSRSTAAPAAALTNSPPIISRAEWGADETCRTDEVRYAPPTFTVVHHTATKNDYTKEEAAQQVRNIYHWHTACHGSGNGWWDIGYNFIVDRFGRIYEGRAGGIERGVVGAHAAGWNTGSFGVAFMGNTNTVTPNSTAMAALRDIISWKFAIHGIDPASDATITHNNQTIPTLVGHRNVRGDYDPNPSTTTDCPGQNLYQLQPSLRNDIALGISPYGVRPWTPVTGDWNGDGNTTPGWFRDGEWRLRNSNSAGAPNLTFTYGQAGDVPVVGDWNGDGRTTVGVVRGKRWLLRNFNSAGPPHYDFPYGRGAIDHPMAGDWNGNGRDTPAIVRDREWHLRNSLSGGPGEIVFVYGRITRGDIPVVGDWNRNGRDTPGILRDGEWHLRNSQTGGPGEIVFVYGRVARGDKPVVGDWIGDGRTTVGVTRSGSWYLRNDLNGGPAHTTFEFV